jgi:hypothetical protein
MGKCIDKASSGDAMDRSITTAYNPDALLYGV